jgi:phosphoribosylglycinamide formyltransferase-1
VRGFSSLPGLGLEENSSMESKEFSIAVLVSGRGTNLQAIIDSMERGELAGARISLVLTDVEDAYALERARQHNIDALYLNPKMFSGRKEYDRAIVERLQKRSIDLVCLAGFMRILGKPFIETFAGRIINIHPSLLPAFPGLHPQRQALDYGVKYSGCTVHYVDESVDGGAIILQSVVEIMEGDDVDSLSRRILEQEHLIYPKAIRLIVENRLTVSGRTVWLKKV